MKTLVVLSALASIALSAPTLQEDVLEKTDRITDWHIPVRTSIPESLKRDKKSTLDMPSSASSHAIHTQVGTTGRSFAAKKPVIVKKKSGYSLYRDSDEEKAHADSHESCGRQVKVKLCDDNGHFKEMLRNSAHELSHERAMEDDMKHSIRMAKEAVENLQRDLKKMEQKNAIMKMAHDDESDTDLHQDIEGVRQALEHIHMNFENLDTTGLHATAAKDSETLHDTHLTIARSEEEKMAQWNSLRTANNEEGLHLDQTESASTQHDQQLEDRVFLPAELVGDQQMREAESTHLEMQPEKKDITRLSDALTVEQLKEHNAREDQHGEDSMKPSGSEDLEISTVDIKNSHMLRSENHEHHELEKSAQEQLEHHDVISHNEHIEDIENTQEHHHLLSMKEAEGQEGNNLDVNKDLLFKASENLDNTQKTSANSIKTVDADASNDHQRNTPIEDVAENFEHNSKQENDLLGLDAITNLLSKSAEHINDEHNGKIHEEKTINLETEKSAETLKLLEEHHSQNVHIKQKDASQSSIINFEDKEMKNHVHKFHHFDEQNENFMRVADHDSKDKHQKIDNNESEQFATLTKMKAAENQMRNHLSELKSESDHLRHHLTDLEATGDHLHRFDTVPVNTHWAHDNRHLPSMKSVEGSRTDFREIDHLRNSHHSDRHFIPNGMKMTHDIERLEHHSHPHHIHTPVRSHHHNLGSLSSMHDLPRGAVSSNFHPSMRDAMEGLGSEHMFRWRPSHESARNAYGGGLSSSVASSGGGAVGVFPNANTGGCGIPLLLSCSPSVVSGSLAKAHSAGPASYSASAYRAEEDFGFHNKRDIKKTNEIKGINMLRTPAIVKQKTGTILENQL